MDIATTLALSGMRKDRNALYSFALDLSLSGRLNLLQTLELLGFVGSSVEMKQTPV